MKEIELNKKLPVITMNFEEVKSSLEEGLSKYGNIVVTDENLKDCKATQKELAGLRNKVGSYRKDVKKEMEAPIKEFESKCKELEALIADTEKPIKEGITLYDDKKRNEKKNYAEKYINKLIVDNQLIPKYADQLTVLPKYLNLSASLKSIREDLDQRVGSLKMQQQAEKVMIENKKVSIKTAIETENSTLLVPLKCEDYEKHIVDWELKTILNFIHRDAEQQREAAKVAKEQEAKRIEEEKAKELEKEEPKEQPKEEVSAPLDLSQRNRPKEPEKTDEKYFVVMRVTGPMDKIQGLSKFLKDNGYEYEAVQKGRVKA